MKLSKLSHRKNNMSLAQLISHLDQQRDLIRATNLARFFKTGKGEYGEGDQFLGLIVPQIREAVRLYWREISFSDLDELLASPYHEHRLTGLLILVKQYEKGDDGIKKSIYDFYLAHLTRINNWDLVDLSAPNIVGDYLSTHPRNILYHYARSPHLWTRRIAILSTFAFIRARDYADSLAIAEILLHDPHDLIHKAAGWMLREIGNRDLPTLFSFLDQHATVMPRTMLRYAIEKLEPTKRQHYMNRVAE